MEASNCIVKIQQLRESLSETEKSLANYILANPGKVVNMQITKLAEECSASVSSVMRFCKKMGYSGYKEFCRYLTIVLPPEVSRKSNDFSAEGPMASIMKNVADSHIHAIESTLMLNKAEDLQAAADRIIASGRVDFYGVGTSGLVAMDAANKFIRLNKIGISHIDHHNQVMSALTLTPNDTAVLISYSGETKDILSLAKDIRRINVPIISITRYAGNTLSRMADIRLFSCSDEAALRSSPVSSRIAQLTLIDILYTAVCDVCYQTAGSEKPTAEK